MRTATLPTLLAFTAGLILAGCSDDDEEAKKDIVDTAQSRGLTTLTTAVTAANLTSTLKSPGPFTVFAPTNAAFSALPAGTLDSLLLPANQGTLQSVLKYHVVAGSLSSTQVLANASSGLTSVEGPTLVVDQVAGSVYINQAKVVTANIAASNGTVHVIDQVLTPPTDIVATLQARGNFTQLINAVGATGLTATVNAPGQKTLLAPTDAAFAAISTVVAGLTTEQIANILAYHLITGSSIKASAALAAGTATTAQGQSVTFSAAGGIARVNGVTISVINIPATNGIIHVIDEVLIPAPAPAAAALASPSPLVAALE